MKVLACAAFSIRSHFRTIVKYAPTPFRCRHELAYSLSLSNVLSACFRAMAMSRSFCLARRANSSLGSEGIDGDDRKIAAPREGQRLSTASSFVGHTLPQGAVTSNPQIAHFGIATPPTD